MQAVGFTLLFGFGLWDDSVIAQMFSGRRGLDILKGVWGQAFWSLLGLVALSAVAWWRRAEIRDAPLLKVLLALGVAMLATVLTNYKDGHGAQRARARRIRARAARAGRRGVRAGALVRRRRARVRARAVGLAARLAQHRTRRSCFPSSERGAWGRAGSEADVKREVAKAEACPPGVAYGGPPFLAFLAGRPMPDDQPDQFLPSRSTRLADVQRRMDAVQPQVRLR